MQPDLDGIAILCAPCQRRAQVDILAIQAFHPGIAALWLIEMWLSCLSQPQEEIDISFLHGCLLPMRLELFLGIFLNRIEHEEAGCSIKALLNSQEILARQRFQSIEHLIALFLAFFWLIRRTFAGDSRGAI